LLDLAGVHLPALGSSQPFETFLTVAERLYNFSSASTYRWNILLPIVEKLIAVGLGLKVLKKVNTRFVCKL